MRELQPDSSLTVTSDEAEFLIHLGAWCRQRGCTFTPSGSSAAQVTRPKHFTARTATANVAGKTTEPAAVAPASWGLAARGAAVEPGISGFCFPLNHRDTIWTKRMAALYRRAAAAQWNPATAIDWQQKVENPPEIENAVVQVMTYLIENETAALVIPARFAGQVHPHYFEVMQLLAIQAADEARHIEVFTRRAALGRDKLGLSTVGGQASLKTLIEQSDFSLATLLLSVLGEGSFLSLLHFLQTYAPDALTRDICRLAAKDEARHVIFAMTHLKAAAEREPGLLPRFAAAIERRHAELMSILNDTQLDEAQRRYLGIIERSGEHLLQVIGNVLDFSKLQASAMERADETFDLNAAVRDALDIYAARASEKNIELVFAPDANAPRFVITDAGKFKQILLNLISNAIKFTERGHVKLTVEVLPGNDQRIAVHIADTGSGMTPEQLERLFKAFSQADSSIAGKYGGTGLGLSISRQLAELLGGSITVTSRVGQGTTFTLVLPVIFDAAHEQATEQVLVKNAALNGKSVLLIDNQQINHEIVQHHLSGLNMTIGRAMGGAEALAYAESYNVDAALIDLNMPDINGMELAEKFRTAGPGMGRILLSSLPVSRSLITEGLFHATLVKPVNRSELLETLQTVISRLAQHHAVHAFEPVLAGKAVLVVEDDETNQMITRMTLERMGATCVLAGTGAEAQQHIAGRNFDFALLDMHLPDLDGYSIADRLRAVRPKLPMIAYSADVALLAEKDLQSHGILAQLQKPVALQQFLDCLRQLGLIQ